MHNNHHGSVVHAAGRCRRWRSDGGVDSSQLEIESWGKEAGELLAESTAGPAEAQGLREDGDEEGEEEPEDVEEGEENDGAGEEEEDAHGVFLRFRACGGVAHVLNILSVVEQDAGNHSRASRAPRPVAHVMASLLDVATETVRAVRRGPIFVGPVVLGFFYPCPAARRNSDDVGFRSLGVLPLVSRMMWSWWCLAW